ncbi:MAG: hypothetical protein GY757_41280, partial [bacterium]|nr:hypothetical protein [bacterium]
VKIRGYRIELGEIERRLTGHDSVKEVVVTAETDRAEDKYLCAYVVLEQKAGEEEPETAELHEYLAQRLPGYMKPSFFVKLQEIPLTANGKIDRKALKRYKKTGHGTQEKRTPPRSERERQLAEIWTEVLGIEKEPIGIDDNFFHMGGHSLKAVLLAAKIHKEFDVRIPQTEIFKAPFIRQITQYINKAEKEKYQAIMAVEKKEYYSLSAAQRRLYILQQMEPGSTVYNMPFVVELEGDLEKKKFEETIKKLIGRHDSFRTAFDMTEGRPVQRIFGEAPIEIEKYSARETGTPDIISDFIRPFELARAPLLR